MDSTGEGSKDAILGRKKILAREIECRVGLWRRIGCMCAGDS